MKERGRLLKIPQKLGLLVVMLLMGEFAFSAEGEAKADREQTIVQQKKETEVSGTVSDSFGPVIGATVLVKGTTVGVVTDLDGNFKLKVPAGATIVVSYIGYENKEIQYKGEKVLNISLAENVQQLEEVQIIAYGAQKKVTITGAVSSVDSKEILKAPVGNVANALSGKITGFSSVQNSAQPGADDPNVYLRGVGSLTEGLSKPLMLVDGVERSFFQLDPNEIEDITVLKDASATAVFGVRGANGVIIVTTKRGQEGRAKISFSTSYGVQMPTRIPEFANSYEYATSYVGAQRRDGVPEEQLAFSSDVIEAFRTGSNPLLYPDTNWTDLLIKGSAWQTQHNFNVSGGTKSVRYFASLGVFTQDGLFNTFDSKSEFKYNRYNYRINMDIDLTKTTAMKINLGGRLNNTNSPNYNNARTQDIKYMFRDIYTAVPFAGAGVVDGQWLVSNQQTFSRIGNFADGLASFYGKGYTRYNENVLNFDFMLEQKLDMLTKGLKVHVKGAYNSTVGQRKRFEGRADKFEVILDKNNEVRLKQTQEKETFNYKEEDVLARDWYLEAAVNYHRNFGHHHTSALAMYNQSMSYYPKGKYPGIPRSYVGLVGRVTYDYKTRYMMDASIGYNGSENFAPGKRFGLFPAGSVGWIFSEEPFMAALKPYLNYLKFRASYGIVGNDIVSDDSRFLYLPDNYNISNGKYSFGNNTSAMIVGANEALKGNPNVTWETSAKQNYGIDLHFFDSRFKTSFDYFIEHRKDILTTHKIDPGYLAVVLPIANIGKVDNKGYEVSARWEDRIREVNYYVGVNLSYAKNTIVYQDEVPHPYEWMNATGRPVGQQFGYKYDGFFTQEEAANYATLVKENKIPDHGGSFTPRAGDVKYKDLNGDHKIDEYDRAAIGYPIYPLLSGGLNMGISWKGFDISMTWSGAWKTSRLLSEMFRNPFGESNNFSLMKYMIDDAWTPEKGNAAKAPALSFISKSNNYLDSDLWLRDASYIRLKNIEVGYSLPKSLLQKMHLGQFRVYMSGFNLLTFDDFKVSDPEANPKGETYPLIKIINFGLKVGF